MAFGFLKLVGARKVKILQNLSLDLRGKLFSIGSWPVRKAYKGQNWFL